MGTETAGRELLVDTLLEMLALKELPRAGWIRKGIAHPESVAAHSYGVSLLALVLLPEDLDRERALAYAVLHDLAECRVGDLTPADGISREEKRRREEEAIEALTQALPRGGELRERWLRYEAQADEEARFVRQLDRLDMALQAVAYRGTGRSLVEFLDSADPVIIHPRLRPLFEVLRQRMSP